MKLKDLTFVDLQFDKMGDQTFIYGLEYPLQPDIPRMVQIPPNLLKEVTAVRLMTLSKAANRDKFRIRHDDMQFRVSRFHSVEGEWFVLRKLDEVPRAPSQIGYHPRLMQAIIEAIAPEKGRANGLVLVTGDAGDGKSSTAASLFLEAVRLTGEKGYTVEDPPEFAIEGWHQSPQDPNRQGRIFQIEVKDGEDFAPHMLHLLRLTAPYIFVGELRSPKEIWSATMLGTRSGLVISTYHGPDIRSCLTSMIAAGGQVVPPETMANALADALTLIVHQRLSRTTPRTIEVSFLFADQTVKAAIRNQQIGQLGTYISQQRGQLQNAATTPW